MSSIAETAEEIAEAKLPEVDEAKEIMASGEDVGLRVWRNEEPGAKKDTHSSPYETVGYVLKGKAELHLEDQIVELTKGNSYLVPKDAEHTYKIIETFSAVEATSPPAHLVHS